VNLAKIAVLGAFLLPATVMVAVAAGPNPAFKLRHDNFEAMGKATKVTFDQLKLTWAGGLGRPSSAAVPCNCALPGKVMV